jgi:hypothetical protein
LFSHIADGALGGNIALPRGYMAKGYRGFFIG